MILNRQILREHIEDERTINLILNNANKFHITYDKMAITRTGALYPQIHFNKDEWITKQVKFLETLRADCVDRQTMMLKLIKGLK